MGAFKELLDLVIPSRCAVCDLAGEDLCQSCRSSLKLLVREAFRGRVRCLSVVEYGEKVSKLLIAFKDHAQASLAISLAQFTLPALDALPNFSEQIYLVPAPSRSENFLSRGYVPSLLIAQAIVRISPGRFKTLNCLGFTRGVRDQVGLTSIQRGENLKGSMKLNQMVSGKVCVVLDDVITTGATVMEAHRVLTLAGAIVPAAVAFSATAT